MNTEPPAPPQKASKGWPHDTLEKLREAGYKYQERSKCAAPSCKVEVYWFITPKLKWMPFNVKPIADTIASDGVTRFEPHFASCPEARKLSRKGTPEHNEITERTEEKP